MTDRQFLSRMVLPLLGVLVLALVVMAAGFDATAYFISNGGVFVIFAANIGWTEFCAARRRCRG